MTTYDIEVKLLAESKKQTAHQAGIFATLNGQLAILRALAESAALATAALQELRKGLIEVKRKLPPATPGNLNVLDMKGNDMANTITFDIGLPPLAPNNDVVNRELTVTIDGGTPDVRQLATTEAVVEGFSVPQGASVSLRLVDVDDGGNRSLPSSLDFVAADTVPPPQPGDLSVLNLDEV